MLTIIRATSAHLTMLIPLLDQYRIFYGQKSNIGAAKQFLNKRITNDESIIFLALNGNKPIGFTQLYKTFSSVSLEPSLILNDLYVNKSDRGRGVGQKLLQKAKEYCASGHYKGLALETAVNNPAQKLYETMGWEKDTLCFHYFWSTP